MDPEPSSTSAEWAQESLKTFVEQISSTPRSNDLAELSEGVYPRLLDLVNNVVFIQSQSGSEVIKRLEELADLAHQKMRSATPMSLRVWRKLYTDSCIVQALILLNPSTATHSISTLDKAIIIAGCADDVRLNLARSLIHKIQQVYLPPQITRQRLLYMGCPIPSTIILLSSSRQVPTVDSSLSFFNFQTSYSSQPFIIRGHANDWPALNAHSWNSIDYLLSVSGTGRIVPVEVGNDYRDDDWSQILMGWEDLLEAVREEDPSTQNKRKLLYLAQHNLTMQFPDLRSDIIIPDYVYCSMKPSDFPGYKPPSNEEGVILNMWLGPKGATSPAHFDPYYNLYGNSCIAHYETYLIEGCEVQIVGHKTVWLAPPSATPYMKAFSPNGRTDYVDPTHENVTPLPPNTSGVDVFSTVLTDDCSPGFFKNVFPHAMQATLGPGDLLFFPPGWWHGMRSESTSFSVSMWF